MFFIIQTQDGHTFYRIKEWFESQNDVTFYEIIHYSFYMKAESKEDYDSIKAFLELEFSEMDELSYHIEEV